MTKSRHWHLWKHDAQSEFNNWAQSYDRSILNFLLFHRCYLKIMELIFRYCPESSHPLRLLDVGCGTGTFLSMLQQTKLPVIPMGLDMAEKMCRHAHQKNMHLSFVNADSEHTPFGDSTYDFITCSNSFHHYPHQKAVLDEFYRILKPGGKVIIIDGYRDNVIGRAVFDVGVALVEKSVHHCSAHQLHQYLRSGGYINIVHEKFGLWVPVLATVGEKNSVSAASCHRPA